MGEHIHATMDGVDWTAIFLSAELAPLILSHVSVNVVWRTCSAWRAMQRSGALANTTAELTIARVRGKCAARQTVDIGSISDCSSDIIALATVGGAVLCVADACGLIHLFRIHAHTMTPDGEVMYRHGDVGRRLGLLSHHHFGEVRASSAQAAHCAPHTTALRTPLRSAHHCTPRTTALHAHRASHTLHTWHTSHGPLFTNYTLYTIHCTPHTPPHSPHQIHHSLSTACKGGEDEGRVSHLLAEGDTLISVGCERGGRGTAAWSSPLITTYF